MAKPKSTAKKDDQVRSKDDEEGCESRESRESTQRTRGEGA